ncbi:MAG: hypothetical protein KAX31_06230 [Thermoplasmata archaeon]|nr:hypothetical protein [Thermoplasmata archaeon]
MSGEKGFKELMPMVLWEFYAEDTGGMEGSSSSDADRRVQLSGKDERLAEMENIPQGDPERSQESGRDQPGAQV